MSLVQFLRILAARKAIILATLLACFLAATITVQLLPERYEARNRVLIDLTKPDLLGSGPMSSQAISSYISTQIKLIKDVQTAGLVVDQLGWTADPSYQASFDAAGRPGGDIRDWLAQRIVDNTEANFVEASSIIEISYRGNDPASTQGIAQAIREAFLKMNRDQKVSNAQRSAASFEEQARRALAEVTKAEEARTQYAKANGIVLQAGNIDLESSKLTALSSASAAPSAPQVIPGRQSDPQVAMLRQQIEAAKQTLGPNHPQLQAMQRQLTAMQSASGGGGSVIGGTSRAEIEGAYQAQKARVLAQADKIDRLNQMQSDIAVKRDQYQKLAAKVEDAKASAMSETLMEPMGNTNLPDEPVWPNKPLVIFGSIALGLVLGVLLALLVELLARRVRSEDDLEFATGAPVLAVVGQKRDDNFLVAWGRRIIDREGASRRRALAEA
ncbi:exopolysaccharide biosynthesis protein EpsF [Sphingomonas sp. ID1715]|uniref:GumC family protein n=1 Tax=Sphingomonas sp. ID1715 TaxID=1656898 RepID=UPI001488B78F|nr:GNVR domain-containing protein [Sphingomonas sp. ID1715]NNM77250.1 exopolysaccharide biosynthesis protein EpsF [Sphingomonas sp. ID1715]